MGVLSRRLEKGDFIFHVDNILRKRVMSIYVDDVMLVRFLSSCRFFRTLASVVCA